MALCELFRNHPEVAGTFSSLTKKMKEIYRERSLSMKEADQNCAADPDWFRKTTFTGMAVNPADFADTLSGLSDKLDYISECNADTLYLTDLFQATSIAPFALSRRSEPPKICTHLQLTVGKQVSAWLLRSR